MADRGGQRTLYEADWRIVSVPRAQRIVRTSAELPLDIEVPGVSGTLGDRDEPYQGDGTDSALSELVDRLWSVVLFFVHVADREGQKFASRHRAAQSAARMPQVDWHPTRPKLAVIASNSVQLYDLSAAAAAAARPRAPPPADVSRLSAPTAELCHDAQPVVRCSAWRPMSRDTLATAGDGSVCLWREINSRVSAAGYSQLMARNGHVAAVPAAWSPTFLAFPGGATAAGELGPVTSLAWHPRGTLLVAGSLWHSTLMVWDVKRPGRACERRRSSLEGGVHTLRWSPCGCYLFVGCVDGTFMLYETSAWEWRVWSHRACGHLVDACWSATAALPTLLLVCSRQIVAFHLTDAAPGLDAQLMPLDAPQIFNPESAPAASTAGSSAAAEGGAREDRRGHALPLGTGHEVIDAVAWDSARDRLVVGLTGRHPLAGHALLFVTSQTPVISALCVGPIYLPRPPCSDGRGPAGDDARGAVQVHKCLSVLNADKTTLLAARCAPGLVTVVPLALREAPTRSATPATSWASTL